MTTTNPAFALEAKYYTDPDLFAREREQVFHRTWQYAGHSSSLARPGDFFSFELHGTRLFCVRDGAGEIRCFYNVCQHRAHQLVKGSGRKALLTCPYHGWTYESNGRLRAAPGAHRVPGFDREKICLAQVRSEVAAGFVFVNLDPQALPFAHWHPDFAPEIAKYLPDLERLQAVYTREVTEQCNWKVSVENYNECYHCRLNHPTFAKGVVDADNYRIVPRDYTLRHVTRSVALEAMSYPVDPDAHPRALEYTSWFLWPTVSFQVYPGNILNIYLWQAKDHRTTRVIRQWFAPDGRESETLLGLAEQDLRTTVAEDIALVESVQRGLESGGYRPGPLIINPEGDVASEHTIDALNCWLKAALA